MTNAPSFFFFSSHFQVIIFCAAFAAVHCAGGFLNAPVLAAPIVSTGVSSSARKQDVRNLHLCFKENLTDRKIRKKK